MNSVQLLRVRESGVLRSCKIRDVASLSYVNHALGYLNTTSVLMWNGVQNIIGPSEILNAYL